MSQPLNQPSDIQSIVRLVKLEASRLELHSVEEAKKAEPLNLDLEAVQWPPLRVDLDADDQTRHASHLRDFLLLDPESFLTKAYSEILGRPADSTGFSHYLQRLSNGESKQKVLLAFINSTEGKERGVRIEGLGPVWKIAGLLNRLDFTGKRIALRFERLLDRFQRWVYFSKGDLRLLRLQIYLAKFNQVSQSSSRNMHKLLSRLDSRLMELDSESRNFKRLLSNAYQQVRQLEYQLDLLKADGSNPAQNDTPPAMADGGYLNQSEIDRFYFAFEEACRGPQSEILIRLSRYIPIVPVHGSKRVVDVGCGRGEWLDLLSKNGFDATGLDINEVMVQICRDKGLNAQKQDVIEFLSNQQEGALAAVTGFHVAEHIPLDLLLRLIKESHRALEKGGVLILETPNPENLLVGSHTFYHDPTHRNPLTPTLMTFMAQYFGFSEVEILRLNPYPEQAKVPGLDPLTERVNGHLCGPQDFALLARK